MLSTLKSENKNTPICNFLELSSIKSWKLYESRKDMESKLEKMSLNLNSNTTEDTFKKSKFLNMTKNMERRSTSLSKKKQRY